MVGEELIKLQHLTLGLKKVVEEFLLLLLLPLALDVLLLYLS
jgi:hypothetical protein